MYIMDKKIRKNPIQIQKIAVNDFLSFHLVMKSIMSLLKDKTLRKSKKNPVLTTNKLKKKIGFISIEMYDVERIFNVVDLYKNEI